MEQEQKTKPISTGAAIIVAGILVAGTLLFTHYDKKTAVVSGVTSQDTKSEASLADIAKSIGINKKEFESCMSENRGAARVANDASDAQSAGISGTPYSVAFDKNGNAIHIKGAASYDSTKKIIDDLLAAKGSLPASQPTTVPAPRASDHVIGSIDAPVVVIEYSDIDCPFCRRFHPVMEQIVKEYPGKVAWIYRHLPLTTLHPEAQVRAEASECVAELGGNDKFWEFLKVLMEKY